MYKKRPEIASLLGSPLLIEISKKVLDKLGQARDALLWKFTKFMHTFAKNQYI